MPVPEVESKPFKLNQMPYCLRKNDSLSQKNCNQSCMYTKVKEYLNLMSKEAWKLYSDLYF
jgi:hypothetical protein